MASDELSLFGPEEATQAPVRLPEDAWGADRPTWTKMSGAARPQVCTHCIRVGKESGKAPDPLRAVHRRRGPNGDDFLCHAHAQQQRELDDRAARLAKSRREITDRAPARKRREGSS